MFSSELEVCVSLVEGRSRLLMNEGGNIVGILSRQDSHAVLRHVVLNEGSHFRDAIHTCAIIESRRPPERRKLWRQTFTMCSMTTCALRRVDRFSMYWVRS